MAPAQSIEITAEQRLEEVRAIIDELSGNRLAKLGALLDALLDDASGKEDLFPIHVVLAPHWCVVGNDACVLHSKPYGALGTDAGKRLTDVLFKHGFGWPPGDPRVEQLLSGAQVFDVARRKSGSLDAYKYDAALFLQEISRAAYHAKQDNNRVLKAIGVGKHVIKLFLTAMENEKGLIEVDELQVELGGQACGAAWASAYWVIPTGKCVLRIRVVQGDIEVGCIHLLLFLHPSRKSTLGVHDLRFYAGAGLRNLFIGETVGELTLRVPISAKLGEPAPTEAGELEYGQHLNSYAAEEGQGDEEGEDSEDEEGEDSDDEEGGGGGASGGSGPASTSEVHADASCDVDYFDFKGKSPAEVSGARITVWYEEELNGRKVDVPYQGVVNSCDPREGLYVKFEGSPEEMLITNEDDWRWGAH